MVLVETLCLSQLIIQYAHTLSLTEFNDNLLYDISWNSPLSEQAEKENTLEKVLITTKHNEQYQCLIPHVKDDSEGTFDVENGPSPEALLSDILTVTPKKCSIRLEPYWTYEVCHGKSITQYHEEKDPNGKIKKHEYILGLMTDDQVKELLEGPKPLEEPNAEKRKVPTKRLEGKDTPYYSIVMDNGTPCDINGKLRKSEVLYICHLSANNEVISVKEVTSCEYEIIILSPHICANPAYTIRSEPINDIQCHPLPGHPSRPQSLLEHFDDDSLMRTSSSLRSTREQQKTPLPEQVKPRVDESINRRFLSGDYCLIGGSGWWNYEFCNGKHIHQFHQEAQKKTVIKLGFWNKDRHLSMVASKAIVPKGKNHVMHYYSGGDICDLTGKPRSALVILTCMKGKGQQLSIYMSEPQPCEYTIGVESPILCPFVKSADENGLFEHMKI